MQNLLLFEDMDGAAESAELVTSLRSTNYRVVRTLLCVSACEAMETLLGAFGGRPPDLLLADLRSAADCQPLERARSIIRDIWGDDVPMPLMLALLGSHHLDTRDWPALVDDFLLAPVSGKEVLARIDLLLFRTRNVRKRSTVVVGEATIDLMAGLVLSPNRQALCLTPREYDLLRFLATHKGKFFRRERLLDLVWGVHYEGGERTVDIHVRRLRAKLPPRAAALLETRRGLGYGFRSA